MGTKIYRVVGVGLSITVALLGTVAAFLLYYAGQAAVDLLFTNSTYLYNYMRINRRMQTDAWYRLLILRCWALAFVYIVTGLSGTTASLFLNKCLMMIHITIAIVALFVGSFMHTAGFIAILLYRLMIVGVNVRKDPLLGDCLYFSDSDLIPNDHLYEKCLTGSLALKLSIAAVVVILIAWIIVLANVLYIAFTFHNVGKEETNKKRNRSQRSRPIPTSSTELETIHHTNTATTEDDGNGENLAKLTETHAEVSSNIVADIEPVNENVQNENGYSNDSFEADELTNSGKIPTVHDVAIKNQNDQELGTKM